MSTDQRLIRQFLRGDPDGPLTERKSGEGYEQELFGEGFEPTETVPSIQTTRSKVAAALEDDDD